MNTDFDLGRSEDAWEVALSRLLLVEHQPRPCHDLVQTDELI